MLCPHRPGGRPSTRASRSCWCPMDQPGIEVRPIINIAGGHEFNEVFFTDARTAKDNVVGEVDDGWAVANTLLGFERGGRATVLSHHLPGGARPAARGGPGAGPTTATRSSASAWPGATPRSRSCATSACGRSRRSWPAQRPGPESSLDQAAVVGVPQARHRARPRHPRPRRLTPRGARRRRASPVDAVGAPYSARRWLRGGPAGPLGHDLRRHLPGAAQHRRRAGARPAQGAPGRRGALEGHPEVAARRSEGRGRW